MSKQFWQIENSSLVFDVQPGDAHQDNIEMSGLYCDEIVFYGVDDERKLILWQKCFFPMLRTIPNNTHGTFCFTLNQSERIEILKNGQPVSEYPTRFTLDGTLQISCRTQDGFSTHRRIFPCSDQRFAVERVRLFADEEVSLSLSHPSQSVHSYGRGTKGVYISQIFHTAPEEIQLKSGETIEFDIFYTTQISGESLPLPQGDEALEKRTSRIAALCDHALVLDTGCQELDVMMRFAKLRAGESIFETLTGKYHSPGGQRYYAATWCNDQIEYAGPHFAMTGDETAIEASLNAYKGYIPFMSPAYYRIPSSIIAEGLDLWEGAGDRGDAAMYLYGASLYCLYLGSVSVARQLYGAIQWCAEYCERHKTPEGVISSDSDELEGRFPTDGKANLSTSSLCYGGYINAAKLAHSLQDFETEALYLSRAKALEEAIEAYFGKNLHGFDTYQYSHGFDTLRAWICLPLCMGITTRLKGTLEAMLSPFLWTQNGMLTCERSLENTNDTFWDRSTLYGMKCAFLCGEGDRMLPYLLDYCHKRLVCERVPYAVEAYPEGDMRHLSAESALFARVITEGLAGIRPEGLRSFSFTARLPQGLDHFNLSSIRICGGVFDLEIGKDSWRVLSGGQVLASGQTLGQRVFVETP